MRVPIDIKKIQRKDILTGLKEHSINGEEIVNLTDIFYSQFTSYINLKRLIKSYKETAESKEWPQDWGFQSDVNNLTYDQIKSKISELLTKSVNGGQYFHVSNFFSRIINNIADQDSIYKNFQEKLSANDFYFQNNSTKLYGISDIQKKDDSNSNMNFSVNNELNFYILKTYNDNCSKKAIDKEIEIFNYEFKKVTDYPNFIIHSQKKGISQIPYFPFQTLESFILASQYLYTNVDKIVMIKEVALALLQLHNNSKSHGNLCSCSLFVNEKKDVYLGGFGYDRNLESNMTSLSSQYYSRYHPLKEFKDAIEKAKKEMTCTDSNDTFEDIDVNDNYEITDFFLDRYSLGTLIYEIITLTKVKDSLPPIRLDRIRILTGDLYDYLFKDKPDFDSKFGITGISNIIKECMNKNSKYNNFQDIINSINELDIYKQNQFEIEYRIKNAISSEDYKCTLSTLIFNYYQGNDYSKVLIQNFFENRKYFMKDNKEKINFDSDDIISPILDFFHINDSLLNFIFEDDFNTIINLNLYTSENFTMDNTNKMLKLSISENLKSSSNLIPITKLSEFVNHSKFVRKKIFIYLLANELSFLHSQKIYHGEISGKSIGIYYDSKSDTFVPSFLYFYFFYIKHKKFRTPFNLDQEKKEKKDIIDFLNIIKLIDNDSYEFLVKNEEKKNLSANIIVYKLYNMNKDDKEFNEYIKSFQYTNLHLSFSTIYKIFNDQENDKKNLFNTFLNEKKESDFFNLQKSLEDIVTFLSILIKTEYQSQNDGITDLFSKIESLYFYILSCCESFYVVNENNDDLKTIEIKENKKFTLCNYSLERIRTFKSKFVTLSNKPVNRSYFITNIHIYSTKFIIGRYINNFDPLKNYRLAIKIPKESFMNETIQNEIMETARKYRCTAHIEDNYIIILKQAEK